MSNPFQKGHIPWNKGMTVDKSMYPTMGHFTKHSEETREKMSLIKSKQARRADASNFWVGDKIKYRGLHNWIEIILGKPQECWICGDTSKHRYHWACIGEYTRDPKNWARLCPKCHKHLDMNRRSY